MQDVPPSPHASKQDERIFRFIDQRGRYLSFVHACDEKQVIAARIAQEFSKLHLLPSSALRLFDAGIGDGTVLARTMAAAHHHFRDRSHYVVGKEISVEDVRLAINKMPDRLAEHPATVVVMTNLLYRDAPGLSLHAPKEGQAIVWHEEALKGDSAYAFTDQITKLEKFFEENWRATLNPAGIAVYDRPAVMVLYREDQLGKIGNLIPHEEEKKRADFDLALASQPYQTRGKLDFKISRVIKPLAEALAPGGRLIGIHSQGGDPAEELIREIYPGFKPFVHSAQDILKAAAQELTDQHYSFAEDPTPLIYRLLAFNRDNADSIGTSVAHAAFNAAAYAAQVPEAEMQRVLSNDKYLTAAHRVLDRHKGMTFNDSVYTIARHAASHHPTPGG
jgi:SAM-dependent methyltransferase